MGFRQNNRVRQANAAGVSPMLLPGGRTTFKPQKGIPDRKGGIAFLRR